MVWIVFTMSVSLLGLGSLTLSTRSPLQSTPFSRAHPHPHPPFDRQVSLHSLLSLERWRGDSA